MAPHAASPTIEARGPGRSLGTGRGGEGQGPTGDARLGTVLARAAAVTAALTAAGALLGLVRDQAIAQIFGASIDSDAFLIAWTVPEMASTLLIEDAMALLLVPAFSHALVRRTADRRRDPVRELVSATLPRLFALLACAAGLLIVGAPVVVRILAPGFADPRLAVDCTRLTAVTVLTFGIAGYFSAALRAHGHFLPPACVYVAYNVGIIATTLALHSLWGVRAAAAGVAVGGLLMILAQLPMFVRRVTRVRPRHTKRRGRGTTPFLGAAVLAPVILFTISRQSQVLVERFLASSLPGGAISHLNYAQKVAQLPMVLSLMICTVTFPVVARAMADGDRERARRRVEQDLALAGVVVLLGTALVLGYAPQIIEVLFERGAFDAQDTETTATVMRIYATGLLGHCLVGALGRPFFSTGQPTWYPAAAMAAGLVVTIAAGAAAVGRWGVYGIAAGNAAGITTTALLLLTGLGSRVVAIRVRSISVTLGRLAVAAAVAAVAGRLASPLVADPLLSTAVGCLLVPTVFVLTALAVRAPEVVHLLALTRQRWRHDR
ncbi:murein biosynthesis integral membrane protein MurJ [Streptomyces sp. NBC_01142]|uniref:murein biosynthesis integral membrane protein MurJ n=1 Tax=Streptomyces sp. NBC_01142 TaxID=2975865 RepID=UPI00224F2BF3|nr:murein biosynthesis integral membrane protein MurJ [Streptomyces sp. NBC_01142]MCX4819044.1 murein biosynthesis integral membrane protein MurJ [Streptomyces sp. NBC_01142]